MQTFHLSIFPVLSIVNIVWQTLSACRQLWYFTFCVEKIINFWNNSAELYLLQCIILTSNTFVAHNIFLFLVSFFSSTDIAELYHVCNWVLFCLEWLPVDNFLYIAIVKCNHITSLYFLFLLFCNLSASLSSYNAIVFVTGLYFCFIFCYLKFCNYYIINNDLLCNRIYYRSITFQWLIM